MLTGKDIVEATRKMEEKGWSPYYPTWEELTGHPPPWKTSVESNAKKGIPNWRLSEFR